MPSLDVIRNVTIKGRADGVDDATAALNRLTASIQAANDNLARSRAISQDNAEGFRITGEGAATAANHLRQAAEAAYAFSPAFRGVVNEMAPAALGVANTALAAVAAGIVTATNYAGTGLIALAGAAEKASPSMLAYTSGVRSAGVAMEAFSPTIGTAVTSLLSFLSPALRLVGWFTLAVKGIEDVGEAWRLGGEKLAEYVALSEKAVASGVSTDFFQRITKSAADARLPVDALTAALAKLRDATSDQLGGTSAQNRLSDLLKAGNFGGNSGIGQLSSANTIEARVQAISSLIDQAMQKGERLAALDVAKTFLGDGVAANLAKDSDYLSKMLASANEIKSSDLISQASIDNAVALQNRLDAAEKILSERWHPIQDLLTQAGIAMREAWVNIVESMATAFDWISKMMSKLGEAPGWFQTQMNRGATAFMNLTTTPEGRAASEASLGISSNPADMAMLAARQRLASGLSNPANVAAATDQLNGIQNKVFPDVSKDPNAAKPDTSAYDRATESVLKYIETTKAASLAVSDAAGEQEKFKIIAQLTAAGMKDGLTPEAAKLKAEMSGLGQQAGAAADALAKARQVSQIEFGRKTAFLSQEDVQIATQLKGIYGNDVPAALNSTYAAGIRLNNAFHDISSSIESNLTQGLTDIVSGAKSAGDAFTNMGKAIVTAIEQMVIKIMIVQPLMQALQNTISGSGFSLGSVLGFGGGAAAPTAGLDAIAAIHHAGGVVGDPGMPTRTVDFSAFAGARRMHDGGIVGDEVPIIAKRGEVVGWPGQMAQAYGAQAPQVTVNMIEDSSRAGQTQQRNNDNGGLDLTVFVDSITAKNAANPGSATSRVLNQRGRLAAR